MNALKKNWLSVLGKSFFVISGLLLIGAIYAFTHTVISPEPTMFKWGPLATLAGVLVALGANLLVLSQNDTDKQEQRSRFYLKSCVLAYDNAHRILKNGNNNCTNWIRAGRMLSRARKIVKEITEESHCQILEIHLLKYASLFENLLDKPAIYFYGVSDSDIPKLGLHVGQKRLDAAAGFAMVTDAFGASDSHDTRVRPIPESALYAVWLATKLLEEQKRDTLKSLHFTADDFDYCFSRSYPGLVQYLKHARSQK